MENSLLKNLWSGALNFAADESGETFEKAIIIGLMAVLAVGGLAYLGPKVKSAFEQGGNAIDDSTSETYDGF